MLSPLLIVVTIVIGVLIGGVGIGGVLLLPALNALGGVALHAAIPSCLLAYLGSGAVGTWLYARRGTLDWRRAAGLCAGGAPGAYLGAVLLPHAPAAALEGGIAALLVASGVYALAQPRRPGGAPKKQTPRENQPPRENSPPPSSSPGTPALAAIGFVVGVGSALTGTGGPLLLIPILVWRRLPMLTAVGLAQVIQLPVAALATVGNALHGAVDWALGAWLAAALVSGVAVGARLAHALPGAALQSAVALLLVAVGGVMAAGLLPN